METLENYLTTKEKARKGVSYKRLTLTQTCTEWCHAPAPRYCTWCQQPEPFRPSPNN